MICGSNLKHFSHCAHATFAWSNSLSSSWKHTEQTLGVTLSKRRLAALHSAASGFDSFGRLSLAAAPLYCAVESWLCFKFLVGWKHFRSFEFELGRNLLNSIHDRLGRIYVFICSSKCIGIWAIPCQINKGYWLEKFHTVIFKTVDLVVIWILEFLDWNLTISPIK